MSILTGTICLWYGNASNVPDGWAICDGTGGTPDLRNRFIVGAGWYYNPGAIGGSVRHLHEFGLYTDGPVEPMFRVKPSGVMAARYWHLHWLAGHTYNAGSLPPFKALYWIKKL